LTIPTKAEKERIEGGIYPSDFNHNPKQILRSPDDGTIGVAILGQLVSMLIQKTLGVIFQC
jgi:hypothetical protein